MPLFENIGRFHGLNMLTISFKLSVRAEIDFERRGRPWYTNCAMGVQVVVRGGVAIKAGVPDYRQLDSPLPSLPQPLATPNGVGPGPTAADAACPVLRSKVAGDTVLDLQAEARSSQLSAHPSTA